MEQWGDHTKSGGKLSPKRVLLVVINKTVELSSNSLDAEIRRFSKTIQTNMKQIISENDYWPLPDIYNCFMNFDSIHFLVINAEGNAYEKVAIET